MAAGVSVIYQQFSLVGHLSVADNIFLGAELRAGGVSVRRREQEARASELLERLGMSLNPRTPVHRLSIAEQQGVEIAKAVNRNARLLILDEPSASLSSAERASLMDVVRSLRDQGVQILYITHLLDEVVELGDDVTVVLRDGRVSLSGRAQEFDLEELIEAISGGVAAAALRLGRYRPGRSCSRRMA